MTDTRDSYLPLVSGDPVGAAARLAEQDAEIERLRAALIFAASWIESGRPIDGLAERMREAARKE